MKQILVLLPLSVAGALAVGCQNSTQQAAYVTKSGLSPENFVDTVGGKPTALYVLQNANGVEACVTNYGGRLVSLMVPDNRGVLQDVVLGFDSIQSYYPENNPTDFGASIGRYANRIGRGRFVIGGDSIQLPVNNFGHTLHGGPSGWQYQVYDACQPDDSTLILSILSPDGDNGFPGNVNATVKYLLTSDNSLEISYSATTDMPTIINLTNHSYFSLSGNPRNTVNDDVLMINASGFTPVDSSFMTTGEILPVKGTPMDFTTPKRIGEDIANTGYEQLAYGKGYDHNWVLDTNGDIAQVAAVLSSPQSGIKMSVYTDQPGIQVYSGNFLDGTVVGKSGVAYPHRSAVCLETQHYPDSPNKPHWPSVLLRPGEVYETTTVYKFSNGD